MCPLSDLTTMSPHCEILCCLEMSLSGFLSPGICYLIILVKNNNKQSSEDPI